MCGFFCFLFFFLIVFLNSASQSSYGFFAASAMFTQFWAVPSCLQEAWSQQKEEGKLAASNQKKRGHTLFFPSSERRIYNIQVLLNATSTCTSTCTPLPLPHLRHEAWEVPQLQTGQTSTSKIQPAALLQFWRIALHKNTAGAFAESTVSAWVVPDTRQSCWAHCKMKQVEFRVLLLESERHQKGSLPSQGTAVTHLDLPLSSNIACCDHRTDTTRRLVCFRRCLQYVGLDCKIFLLRGGIISKEDIVWFSHSSSSLLSSKGFKKKKT